MFLYTDNKISENKIKKTIPFLIASETVKSLGVNVTEEVKDVYNENYKDFDERNWGRYKQMENILSSWIRRINIDATYRFNAMSILSLFVLTSAVWGKWLLHSFNKCLAN